MNFEEIEEQKARIKQKISKGLLLAPEELQWEEGVELPLKKFVKGWYRGLYDFKFLSPKSFDEQIFHAGDHVQTNCRGQRSFDGEDLTKEDFQLALEIMTLRQSVHWNEANPFASFDITLDGRSFRASLLHHSVCKGHGSKLFLRSIAPRPFSFANFDGDSAFLSELATTKKNELISGATGSGKTSLLNAFLNAADPYEHLIMVEDTCELLAPHANATKMVSRQNHPDDLKNFLTCAMRMSPDRIVVGELRSREVEPYLLAMNCGHRGVLASIHANSAKDAVSRAALLARLHAPNPLEYELVLQLIAQNLDYVIHVENKKIKEVCKIYGAEGGQLFYEELMSKKKAA